MQLGAVKLQKEENIYLLLTHMESDMGSELRRNVTVISY